MRDRARLLRSTIAPFVVVAWAFLAVDAASAEETLEDLLVEKGIITEEELESLRKESEEAQAPSPEPKDEDPNSNIVVKASHKGLSVETRDGAYKFAFGGRLQVDGAVFDEDETNLGDGMEMRRARIKSFGTVGHDWDYKLEVNFDPDGSAPVTDGWIRYSGFKPFTATIGHQKVPFSQQSMSSSNWQVFQERSLGDAFIDNQEHGRRRMGMVLASHGDYWLAQGGGFAGGTEPQSPSSDDWGVASRLVFVPIAEKTRLLTLGGAFIYRQFQGDSQLRIRARPGSHVANNRLVDTGPLPTSNWNTMVAAETAFVWDRFHAQAEYVRSFIKRRAGDPNLELDSWYVQAGVFLTGESRVYDKKSGKFKRPIPESKWGAWEIAARFDSIDLQDEDIRGGKQRDVTVGLNWWTNRNIMFRMNYVYAHANNNSGTGTLTPGDDDEKVHAFMARTQVVF